MGPVPCLDVTRLATRAGRGPLTGIDRVERAWLRHFASDERSLFLLRTTRGYLLIDPQGARQLDALLSGATFAQADGISRLFGKSEDMRHRAEASLRPFARDRCLPKGLDRMLLRALPRHVVYVNVGHANLSRRVLASMSDRNIPIVVMLHDTIPADFPEFARWGEPESFREMLARCFEHADLFLVPSHDAAKQLSRYGNPKDMIVVPLGVEVATAPQSPPTRAQSPYFVSIGTMERRKNHALLLDVWDILAKELPGEDLPNLHLIGHPGKRNQAFFDRLSGHPLNGHRIHVDDAMGDGEAGALLAHADALLFPTLAEGFGLPPLEAKALGVPQIVSDLPVLRETLGTGGIYLDPKDPYPWAQEIRRIVAEKGVAARKPGAVPTWADHFRAVEKALDDLIGE